MRLVHGLKAILFMQAGSFMSEGARAMFINRYRAFKLAVRTVVERVGLWALKNSDPSGVPAYGAQAGHLARWRDRRYMSARRADYYRYVRALLVATDGRRSLRDFFLDDACRYGASTPRGRVCAVWHLRFEQFGGSLAQTWAGVYPDSDLAIIAMAQNEGARALPTALADLARTTDLVRRVRQTLWATCATGVVACAVVMTMLAAMPGITVPRLQQVFESVPPVYYGAATRTLYASARVLEVAMPIAAVVTLGAMAALTYAMPRWTGRLRRRFDVLPMFRLYRDFQAIRFLCALTLMIGEQKSNDLRMRDGLNALACGAVPWMSMHVEDMAQRMESGVMQEDIFDTGLFDRETFWFLSDVIQARGLGIGLVHVRERIEDLVAAGIVRQSRTLRWVMLLSAVGCALGIAFWHFAALDELRRALSYALIVP